VFRSLAGAAGALAALALIGAAPAAAQVEPYGYDNYGYFNDVLPPGTNGLVDVSQLAAYEAFGTRPPHNDDQLAMYSNLTTAAPNIKASQISQFFKSSIFGVPAGDVGKTETPEPGVTIEWDSQYGVPHIYGDTRAELMFGIGWATAEDRLFFIDALRHAGQADLAQFAGGSNVAMDESVWANEPYTQQDLVNQVNYVKNDLPGGAQVYADAQNYVDGINAYIAQASNPLFTATMMPAEYALLGIKAQPWTVENLVSIATLVGGIFGVGGGGQLQNAELYEQLVKKFGGEQYNVPGSPQLVAHPRKLVHGQAPGDHSGFATFMSFDDPDDPEAPTTVHGRSFPYQTLPAPSRKVLKTIALPDPGSVQAVNPVSAGAVPSGGTLLSLRRSRTAQASSDLGLGLGIGPLANAGTGLFAFPRSMSNALLVSAKDSATGYPIEVMGPQVAYFTPEILMEEDIHGPGIDAAGAAFPGVNLYVELGHGPDYAWSATSAGQNIVDTFAVPLCNPSGGAVSKSSDYYLLHGQCVQMQTLNDSESWTPNVADSTPPGSVTFSTQRTAFGIVVARATVHGKPVAYTNLRSTYMHELDSATGFESFNEPAQMRNPQDFFNAAAKIGYTFNWFYADNKNIAYFNSGENPVRAPNTDPLFPTWSQYAWKGWAGAAAVTPGTSTEVDTPENAHPHVANQPFLTSWNNKQAPGYNDTATDQEFSSVYRSQLLDLNIEHYLKLTHDKMTLVDLINAMGNAGTQDLRGVEVLPYALDIIGHPKGPAALVTALQELRTWVASGAHRINRAAPGASGEYQQGTAVQLMDAWWPLLIQSEFQPVLGPSLLSQVESDYPINDEPGHGTSGSHLGSSWDVGFYGIVQKDLRAALGRKVLGPLNRVFCGKGSLTACRKALEASLLQAAAESPDQVYPADGVCKAGDQMCHDSIKFRAIGAVSQPLIEWVNRPTFQQADMITGHMP
jgi:acyl-homoserine lactone acylase PvdQ